jgi:hypothetical protein
MIREDTSPRSLYVTSIVRALLVFKKVLFRRLDLICTYIVKQIIV